MDRVALAIRNLVENALNMNEDGFMFEQFVIEALIQIVATILLILVVKFFFWGKITAFIDARRAFIDKELIEATEKNEEASMLKEEAEKAFEQVKQEARQIIEEAKTRGEDSRRELLAKAKDEAANIKKSAQKDLAQEIEVARSQIRNEIIEVASFLAQKVIDQEIDKKTYDRLIDQAIEEVRNR